MRTYSHDTRNAQPRPAFAPASSAAAGGASAASAADAADAGALLFAARLLGRARAFMAKAAPSTPAPLVARRPFANMRMAKGHQATSIIALGRERAGRAVNMARGVILCSAGLWAICERRGGAVILGVGIDMVSVSELTRMCVDASMPDGAGAGALPLAEPSLDSDFATYIFTDAERAYASAKARPFESLAGMFAVKEAVFKAVAHLTPEETFDLRAVQTEHAPNGFPQVKQTPEFQKIMEAAQVLRVHISITNENGFAVAIAVAEGSGA